MKISKFIYGIRGNASIWLSGVLLLLFLATSCTEEENGNSPFTGEESTAFFDVSTRAFGNGDDTQVNTVRVIVARQDYEGTIISNTFVPDPDKSSITVKTKSGLCNVFVVTNEMPDKSELPALNGAKTIQELQQVNIPYSVSNRIATNLPMKGEVRNVFIHTVDGVASETNRSTVVVDGVSSSALEVNVKRLAVRVDLRLMSQSFAKLESVKITNIPDAVSLFGNTYEAVDAKKQTVTVENILSPTPLTGYVWEKSKSEIYLPSSVFSPSTDSLKAIKLDVKIEGRSVKTVSLGHLMEKEYDPKDYTLHPNTHYTFTGRIIGEELEISASIADWKLAKQDYPTGGGKWVSHPSSIRVGINRTVADTARFTAEFLPGPVSYNWYRRYQEYDPVAHTIKTLTVPLSNVETDILSIKGANSSTLSIATKHIAVSGEIYCIASTFSPDETVERSESKHVTYMVVGENYVWAKGTYPSMQEFKAPSNAPLGSTCILQDDRDNKLYHVKLMADGNWWMIQDLAYGNASSKADFIRDCANEDIVGVLGQNPDLYGLGMASELEYGGYWYNSFIHQIKGVKEDVSRYGNQGVYKQFLPAICPSGWHLPGNMDNVYNKEWTLFASKMHIDLTTQADLLRYEYNNAFDFNAYTILTDIDPDLLGSISFRGGYFAQFISPAVNLYGTVGITTADYYGGIMTYFVYNAKAAVPVRCVKDFK